MQPAVLPYELPPNPSLVEVTAYLRSLDRLVKAGPRTLSVTSFNVTPTTTARHITGKVAISYHDGVTHIVPCQFALNGDGTSRIEYFWVVAYDLFSRPVDITASTYAQSGLHGEPDRQVPIPGFPLEWWRLLVAEVRAALYAKVIVAA